MHVVICMHVISDNKKTDFPISFRLPKSVFLGSDLHPILCCLQLRELVHQLIDVDAVYERSFL